MPSCVVKWCVNNTTSNHKCSGITFHRFPGNPLKKEAWIQAVRLERREQQWNPTNHTRICSIHFHEDDFYVSKNGYRMLNKTASPICTMVTLASRECVKKNISTNADKENSDPQMNLCGISNQRKRKMVACPSCGCSFGVTMDVSTRSDLNDFVPSQNKSPTVNMFKRYSYIKNTLCKKGYYRIDEYLTDRDVWK